MSSETFRRKFDTEEKCRQALFNLRFPDGFKCPKCGSARFGWIRTRNLCQCKDCHRQTSVTAGTALDKTHLPLRTWFRAMWLFANDKRGCSASHLANDLDLRYATAWYVLARLRSAMGARDAEYLLSGTVEVDDAYFGGARGGGKRGRGTKRMKAVVAVSKGADGKPRFAKIQFVKDLRGVTIGRFAKKSIEEGSRVESDAYRAYQKPLASRYFHKFETFSADKRMLVWVHRLISNAKALFLGTYHGVHDERYFQFYLDEICFRYNRRYFNSDLCGRLSLAAMHAPPWKLCLFNEQNG